MRAGHEGGQLLVAGLHEVDVVAEPVHRAHQAVDAVARVTVDAAHAPLVQTAQQMIGDGAGHGSLQAPRSHAAVRQQSRARRSLQRRTPTRTAATAVPKRSWRGTAENYKAWRIDVNAVSASFDAARRAPAPRSKAEPGAEREQRRRIGRREALPLRGREFLATVVGGVEREQVL